LSGSYRIPKGRESKPFSPYGVASLPGTVYEAYEATSEARTFYFACDDIDVLNSWCEAIKKNIRLLQARDFPIRTLGRLVEEVGGSLAGWNIERLLDLVYGYSVSDS
jgi:hypothetical protein